MIIDGHAHVWSADTTAYPFAPLDRVPAPAQAHPVEELLAEQQQVGVDGAVLIQPRHYGYNHGYLTSVLADNPGRVAGVCLVNPQRESGADELRQYVEAIGFRGLRLIGLGSAPAPWLTNERRTQLLSAAIELEVVVSVLVDPDQLTALGPLAAAHPQLDIVIDHLGRCRADSIETERQNLLELARLSNVHVKVSALHALSNTAWPYADLRSFVRRCYDTFGPERLLWGTDFPHVLGSQSYPEPFETLASLLGDVAYSDLAQIAGGNATRLYGIT